MNDVCLHNFVKIYLAKKLSFMYKDIEIYSNRELENVKLYLYP